MKTPFVKSQDQLEDIFTKSLGRKRLVECYSKLRSYDIYAPKLEGECYRPTKIKAKRVQTVPVQFTISEPVVGYNPRNLHLPTQPRSVTSSGQDSSLTGPEILVQDSFTKRWFEALTLLQTQAVVMLCRDWIPIGS